MGRAVRMGREALIGRGPLKGARGGTESSDRGTAGLWWGPIRVNRILSLAIVRWLIAITRASIRRQSGTSWMPEAQKRPWVSKMTFAVLMSTSPKRDVLCNRETSYPLKGRIEHVGCSENTPAPGSEPPAIGRTQGPPQRPTKLAAPFIDSGWAFGLNRLVPTGRLAYFAPATSGRGFLCKGSAVHGASLYRSLLAGDCHTFGHPCRRFRLTQYSASRPALNL